MVYRDYWALAQWYDHFGRHLGHSNLFIVAHGHDPKIAAICPEASVITVPRDDLTGFDRARGRMLNGFQDGLSELYDWVIRTDADELICLDPDHFGSFADLFGAADAPALFATGLNLAEIEGDPTLQDNELVFAGRRNAVFSGHYSKAFAVNGRLALMRHGVQVGKRGVADFRFRMPMGVYLVHLKYANLAALQASNVHRTMVAGRSETGLPGAAWKDAAGDAAKFFRKFAKKRPLPWEIASRIAHEALSTEANRQPDDGIVRAKSLQFDFRTLLPDWFQHN